MVHRPTLSTTERAAIRSRVEFEEAQKARERAELLNEQIEHQKRRAQKERERQAREAKLLPSQCRAARALLNWTQEKLATGAGVAPSTLREFEAGRTEPKTQKAAAIRRALESGGVEFTSAPPLSRAMSMEERRKYPGAGVRWASSEHKDAEYTARDEKPSRQTAVLVARQPVERDEHASEQFFERLREMAQLCPSVPPPRPKPEPELNPLSREFISAARTKRRRR
jgi:transcriptional regulator with XRE-family HTH domain